MSHLASILGALALALLAAEIVGQATFISRWLIEWAARHLPKSQGVRLKEEWLAHLDDCRGPVSKILHAAGCFVLSIRRRPLDMNLWEALFCDAIALVGHAARIYGRYSLIKAKIIYFCADLSKKSSMFRISSNLRKESENLTKLAIMICQAGTFAILLRDFAFLKEGDSILAKKLKKNYLLFGLSNFCFYSRSVLMRRNSLFAMINSFGIKFVLPEPKIELQFAKWADQHQLVCQQFMVLSKALAELAARRDEAIQDESSTSCVA